MWPFWTIFPSLIKDAIVIQYSRNCRRDWYPILKESETQLISNIQQIVGDAIDIQYSTTVLRAEALVGSTWYSRVGHAIDIRYSIDGDTFDIQYSTSCRRGRYLILTRRRSDCCLILIRRRRNCCPIFNKLETRLIFNTAWQRENLLTMVKLIYNKNTGN